jgi:uncharacterized zinc-type alcohol dehydrogenase-like protein
VGLRSHRFSTSPDKEDDARRLGAHHFIHSKYDSALEKAIDSFDFLLVTVNVELDWQKYITMLRPNGKLHLVGAAPKVSSEVFPLIMGQKTIGASPLGSPSTAGKMLEFSARHKIVPETETMPLSEVNEALKRLHDESPAHRIVLKNDFD